MVALRLLSDPLDGFRFHLLAANKAQPTIKNYLNYARAWLNWCDVHNLSVADASRNQVMSWLGQMSLACASSTVRLATISIRVYYDYLIESGQVEANPARPIKVLKQVARPVEPFSDPELRRMRGLCKGAREIAIFYLLLGGGMRRNELAGISREDVNFDAGTIRIFGKGRKYRTVKPGLKAIEALKVALWSEDRLIMAASRDYAYRLVKRWAKLAGINERAFTHRFRYTFAVQFLDNGGSVEHLQMILGHTTIQQSLAYSNAGREQRAMDAQLKFNPADLL